MQGGRRGTTAPSSAVHRRNTWCGLVVSLVGWWWGLADADHASDDESRRSVSCSHEFLGCHLLDQEVGRQTCVALSSGGTGGVRRMSRNADVDVEGMRLPCHGKLLVE